MVIGKKLTDLSVTPGNVYNMDKTGVLLNIPSSLKVLIK